MRPIRGRLCSSSLAPPAIFRRLTRCRRVNQRRCVAEHRPIRRYDTWVLMPRQAFRRPRRCHCIREEDFGPVVLFIVRRSRRRGPRRLEMAWNCHRWPYVQLTLFIRPLRSLSYLPVSGIVETFRCFLLLVVVSPSSSVPRASPISQSHSPDPNPPMFCIPLRRVVRRS